jgi:hypothetical protein
MGAFVTTRQRSSRALTALPTQPKVFAHAAIMAGATLALLAGLPNAAHALPFNLFEARTAPRPSPGPAANVQRPAPTRTATTTSFVKSRTVSKPEASLNELAAKARGPLRIIISLDRQQLTLYSGDEVIARVQRPAWPFDSHRRVQHHPEGPLAPIQSL